ncbi:hypothetical protein R1sor_015804 [Riccia sorocarpa]|uniref:CCHC-type domain-containing protein n=1 Tax=Riccia sorocarpa TaxID=122646 RepID=A0ABD3HHA1_9MARC
MPMDLDPPTSAGFAFKEGYVEFEMSYEPLPEGCYTCHQNGHIAKFCPTTTSTREISEVELEAAKQEAEKAATREKDTNRAAQDQEAEAKQQKDEAAEGRKPQKASQLSTVPTPVPTANPFSLLDDEDDLAEDSPTEDTTAQTAQHTIDLNISTTEEVDVRGASKSKIYTPVKRHKTGGDVTTMQEGATQMASSMEGSGQAIELLSTEQAEGAMEEAEEDDTEMDMVEAVNSPHLPGRLWSNKAGNEGAPEASSTKTVQESNIYAANSLGLLGVVDGDDLAFAFAIAAPWFPLPPELPLHGRLGVVFFSACGDKTFAGGACVLDVCAWPIDGSCIILCVVG